MRFIDDCDSLLPINLDVAYFNSPRELSWDIVDFRINNTTDLLNENEDYDLVIIGGGLTGVSMAARANQNKMKKIAMIDKNDVLMENFIYRTKNINQKVLRSPYRHHLGPVEQVSLADFARLNHVHLSKGEKEMLKLDRKGERAIPSLSVFLKHSAHVIKANNILSNTFKGAVKAISRVEGKWIITTDTKKINAKRIILALGNESKLKNSDFKKDSLIPTYSALDDKTKEYLTERINHVCVNGSGNTAAHVVYDALTKGKTVNWVLRSELVYRCADIPNEFWRTEGLSYYQSLTIEERMKKLTDIYHGSAMPEHNNMFRQFIKKKKLIIHENTSVKAEISNNKIELESGVKIKADIHVKSFGLKPAELPTFNLDLPFYNGFPVLDDATLKWSDDLYVASSLAALSLGPPAKNIDGMRMAIEKIFTDIDEINREGIVKNRNVWGTFGPVGNIRRIV